MYRNFRWLQLERSMFSWNQIGKVTGCQSVKSPQKKSTRVNLLIKLRNDQTQEKTWKMAGEPFEDLSYCMQLQRKIQPAMLVYRNVT